MSRQFKITVIIAGIVIISGLSMFALFRSDDIEQIEEEINKLELIFGDVSTVELVEDDFALAIYTWGSAWQVGVVELSKTIFGWETVSMTSEEIGGNLQFVELSRYTVMHNSIEEDVTSVDVTLNTGEKREAEIREIGNTKSFLYYSDTEDLSNAIVTTYDEDGEVVEVIEVPDQPNEGLDRTVE
ncbi:hypothetical protein [Amphibacillus cookii]|uniref:hypothetical protein n=1 Tax=Amphibacillus cookii TaxID=767787 RepID=UPI001EF99FEA|nr:hypothetical protein [Amphibacillus cookii]MBM7542732.1 hypothetical protein [Amphibacillus cookii]